MEITIKTKGKQQEKYLLAILNSLGIAYSEVKKKNGNANEKNDGKKKPLDVLLSIQKQLNGIKPAIDYKQERIMSKHK